LRGTLGRPGRFNCFGLHEWAMVYRAQEVRHSQVPLRLGQEGTDEVVRSHPLRCTHFDAFRFFTDEAAPRNERRLDRASQMDLEQPGCLHANMDTYKLALKLGPAVPGELLLDTFELARDIRELDMRASPYDLREWGYQPVPIETAAGKATYVAAQREFAGPRGCGTACWRSPRRCWAEPAGGMWLGLESLLYEVTSSPEITLLTISAVCFLRPEGTAPQLKPESEESAGVAESAELLTVRKQGTSRFMLPGGKLDPGEDAQQAAVREVAEELGLTIDSGDLTL